MFVVAYPMWWLHRRQDTLRWNCSDVCANLFIYYNCVSFRDSIIPLQCQGPTIRTRIRLLILGGCDRIIIVFINQTNCSKINHSVFKGMLPLHATARNHISPLHESCITYTKPTASICVALVYVSWRRLTSMQTRKQTQWKRNQTRKETNRHILCAHINGR